MRKLYEAISQVISEKKFVSGSKTQPIADVDYTDSKGNVHKASAASSSRALSSSSAPSGGNRLPAVVQDPKITKIPTAPSAASRATSLAKGLATRGNIVTALALHHGSLNDNEDEDLAARRAADPNFKQVADKLAGPKDALSVIDRYAGLNKYVAQNKSNLAQASNKPSKPYKDSSGTEYDDMGNPSKAAKPTSKPADKPYKDSAGTEYDAMGNPSKLVKPTKTAKQGSSDFGKAFAAARKDQGAGGEFEWNGKKYGTNLKGENNKPQASVKPADDIDQSVNNSSSSYSGRDVKAEPNDNEDAIKKQPAMSYAGGNLAKSKAKDPLDAVRPASSEDIETAKKKFKLDVVENRSVKSVYAAARSVMERHNIRNKPDQIDELVVPTTRAAIALAEPALVGAARFGASMLKNLFRNKPQQSSSKELTTTKPQTETPGQVTAPKQLEAPKPSPSTAVTVPKPVAAPKPSTSTAVAVPKPVAAPKQLNVPKTKTEVKTQTQMAKIPPAIVTATTVKDPEPETKPELAKVPPSPPAPPSITSMGPRGDGPRKSEPQWQKIQPIPDWKDDKKDDSDNKPPMIHPTNVIPEPKPTPRPYITPVPMDNKPDDDTPQANSVEVPKPSEAPEVKIPEPKAPEPVKAAPSVKPDWFVRTPGSPRKTADGKEEAGYLTSTPKKGEENATHDGTDIPKSAVYHGSGAAQHAAQIRGHDWNKVKEYSSNQMQTGISGPAYKYDNKWHAGDPTSANMEMKKQKTVKEEIMSVNKKFGVSDSLYQSVMEVMKAKKQSSEPRNDKEEDLAKQYGDPKRITHGDILVARGVVKPNKVEEENVQEMSSKMKMKLGLYNKKKPVMKENKDTPGNSYEHQCAIHVKSESFGEGRTVTTQHADPDHDGYIAWYDVMFEHGIEKYVPTAELEILVSESHMHSKRKKTMREDAATDRAENDARTEKTLAKMRQRNSEGKGFNVSSDEDPKPDTAAPAAATAPKGQAASSYAGARSVDAQDSNQAAAPEPDIRGAAAMASKSSSTPAPAPAQAPATPRPAPTPAQSDAMSAIDGGSIGTSQSSFQTGPRDLKQGIAANAPAARVVSTSPGAKEAGVPQPNPRIAGFQSNARAREQAAGAAGVEAPMPGGGGKTIAQVRQDLGGKPVSGTPAADAAAKQNMAGNAPAARVVSKQDQAYPQGDKTVGNYDYKNKEAAANPSGSGSAPTPQASSTPAPGAPKINPKSNIAATIERKKQEFMDQARAAGIPDKAEFTAGQKPGETRSTSYSVDTKGGVPQASSTQVSSTQPAGESPEEKARKAAAQKKPGGSFQQMGMVGNDF